MQPICDHERKSDKVSVLIVVGTRPEVIKLAPLYREFQRRSDRIRPLCCVTGQHRDLLDPLIHFFHIRSDYDLNVFREDQGLSDVTTRVIARLEPVLASEKPDMVLVQGDTTSAFAAAVAAFYKRIPVGHVEAGLRSHDRFRPYPEEVNRACISRIADLHFCPTRGAAQNLLTEGIPEPSVFVTGNTVIDALLTTRKLVAKEGTIGQGVRWPGLSEHRMVLVTAHRRESFGTGLKNLSLALIDIAEKYDDVMIVASLHPNPHVRGPVQRLLGSRTRIKLIEPQDYMAFVSLMTQCFLIITDSGGIQEEAPSLCKPVLVAREVTERPEAVSCGAARMVGTDRAAIVREASRLLDDPVFYASMIVSENPFGDGRASQRIADIVESFVDRAGANAYARTGE